MDHSLIESFVRVAKEMSFSKAADSLFITQSTISARIKNLENILGVPLFLRSGKEIRLSQFGELYLPFAEKCQEILAEGKRKIEEKRNYMLRVRIGVSNPFSTYVLPYVLPEFYRKFPEINIQVVSFTYSADILPMIHDSQIDIGFVSTTESLNQQTVNFLKYTTLYQCPLVMVCNSAHRETLDFNMPLSDIIAKNKFIFTSGKTAINKLVTQYFETHGLKPAASIEINSVTAAKEIIKISPVLTMVPKIIVNSELESGEFVEIPLPLPPSHVTSIVSSQLYHAPEILNFFKEKVNKFFEQSKIVTTM